MLFCVLDGVSGTQSGTDLFWWLVGRTSWDNAWGDASYVFNVLGFVFAPWAILMFLLLGGEPVDGWSVLEELANLSNEGLLSDEELAQAMARILGA